MLIRQHSFVLLRFMSHNVIILSNDLVGGYYSKKRTPALIIRLLPKNYKPTENKRIWSDEYITLVLNLFVNKF